MNPKVALQAPCKLSSHYQTFFHFLTLWYLFTFYVVHASYKCTCYTHHKNNSLSPVLSWARSLRQYIFLTHQASLAIVPFWCGGIDAWRGVSTRTSWSVKSPSHTIPTTAWRVCPSAIRLEQTCGYLHQEKFQVVTFEDDCLSELCPSGNITTYSWHGRGAA